MQIDVYDKMWELFKLQGINAFSMNHYDLRAETSYGTSDLWKEFLQDSEVIEWTASEMAIIQQSELKKIVVDINSSKSIGQAQLMTALSKLTDTSTTKDGPTFVYCYIPPSEEQEQADNVIALPNDPFIA
jgi:hypothetical protein